MALDRQRQLVARHAVAVVGRRGSRSAPPSLSVDLDAGGAGVERVLDQLLERGRRALDHLAGGDAVDGVSGRRRIGMRAIRASWRSHLAEVFPREDLALFDGRLVEGIDAHQVGRR